MVGSWCLGKLWTKGTVKCIPDYMDTNVVVYSAADECCQVTAVLAVAPKLFIQFLYRGEQTVKSDRKYKNKTNTRSKHKETDSSFGAYTTAVCASSVCAAERTCIVAFRTTQSFLCHPFLLCAQVVRLCAHQRQAVLCACRGLYWARGTADAHKCSGDLGIRASPGLQRLSWEQAFKSRSMPWNNRNWTV